MLVPVFTLPECVEALPTHRKDTKSEKVAVKGYHLKFQIAPNFGNQTMDKHLWMR